MFTCSQNWFRPHIELEIENYMTMLSRTCTDTLFIIHSNLMWKLNSRKLDHDMQFDFIIWVVGNFISAQYFLCIDVTSKKVLHTWYFFLFSYPFRRTLYILCFRTLLATCNFSLLTFWKHTHFFMQCWCTLS